jgi:non-specific serine/threonine protein kinase
MNDQSAAPPRSRLQWRFGDACFDEASLHLTLAGQPVELERRPLQLLALLLAHAGEIVTKDEILDALWPGREVSEASLTTCMTRLRQALGEAGYSAIRTVHGYGYRFDAPLTVTSTSPAAPVTAVAAPLTEGEPVPHRPGWRLLHRLGAGGFGEAWLTEHAGSHERRVVKFAHGDQGLAGLKREVALWRLLREGLGPRPDLIRILDWQFAEPPAFIETVWAEPGNLADWAAGQGGAAAVPMALRLDLAAQIADVLAAIHSMAVLHKDLKPANVLVRLDADGRPGIILTDFGSGRALDPARMEAFGITRPAPDRTAADSSGGTHVYQAPEYFAGAAPTVQADIFSLGVMLFQLAAGDLRRPLAAGWEDLISDPLLREDIAAAAAGDPARRLADAGTLAARLRALPQRRADRARTAAAEAEAARLRRAMEIHRARRATRLALAGVLVLGCATSTLLYLRAEHAREVAEQARVTARAQAARAEAVTAFLTDDFFSAANPLLGADPNISMRRVLGVAATDLGRRFPAANPDRAAIEAAIGGAYAGLADADHALPLLRTALATFQAQLGDDDPHTQAVRIAMARLAEHMLDPAGMRDAGQAILAAHPRDPETELTARFFVVIGSCYANGNSAACAAQLQPLLTESTNRLGPRHPQVIRVQGELARQLGDAQQFAQAIAMAQAALVATQQVFGPDHLLSQERRFDYAQILVQADRAGEAIAILADVHRRLVAIAGGETELSARVENQLGMAYYKAQSYAESLQAYQDALDYSTRTRGETATLSVAAVNNMAQVLAAMGRTKDAVATARKALDLWRRAAGPDQTYTLQAERNLANDLRQDGDLAGSETVFRDVVARARRVFTHGEYYLGQFESEMGELLAQEGKSDEARALLTEGLAALTKSLGPADRRTLHAGEVLALQQQR